MALAIRVPGAPIDVDWTDDRVLHTAWALLADEDDQARHSGGRQMSG